MRIDRYAINIDVEDIETGERMTDRCCHASSLHLVVAELQEAIEEVENKEAPADNDEG